MSDTNLLQQTHDLIARDFDWEDENELHTEEELIVILSQHIAWLIDKRTEYLFSLMYRLDVPEMQVRKALNPGQEESPAIALARVVVKRQKQRIATKNAYKQEDLGEDAW